MIQNIKSIQSFARKLISVNSDATLKRIYSLMLIEEISLVPVIDNRGRRNLGTYRRKKMFEWLIKNPGKIIDETLKNEFKEAPLPEVKIESSLEEAMNLLRENSAILVKREGIYSHLITPKVIANALEVYATRFLVFERIEKSIRKKVITRGIKLGELNSEKLDKEFPNDPLKLDFGQYIILFSKKWEEMGLSSLHKGTIIDLLNSARKYRNALMHFRLDEDIEGLEDAKKLLKQLE